MNTTNEHSAPLRIDGYDFVGAMGTFSLGSSYLYQHQTSARRVHILLAPEASSLAVFTAAFEDAVGEVAADIVLFAGLTNHGRPYLVTDFIDETESDAPAVTYDATVLSARAPVDETLLSVSRSRQPAPEAGADDTRLSPVRRRIVLANIPQLVVSEREARVPNPLAPAVEAQYAPRQTPGAASLPTRMVQQEPLAVQSPQVGIRAVEQRRSRFALIAIGASVVFSVVASIALIATLFGG